MLLLAWVASHVFSLGGNKAHTRHRWLRPCSNHLGPLLLNNERHMEWNFMKEWMNFNPSKLEPLFPHNEILAPTTTYRYSYSSQQCAPPATVCAAPLRNRYSNQKSRFIFWPRKVEPAQFVSKWPEMWLARGHGNCSAHESPTNQESRTSNYS